VNSKPAFLNSKKKQNKMKNSVIDLHLSSTHYADSRSYRLGHCQMVSWLINNFRKIKSEEVTYKDYESFGNSQGIITYNEESFNTFKEQQYV
jgi:hypothetical protein